MSFFRYTSFLEEENRTLKQRIEHLEKQNQEIILAIYSRSPILRESAGQDANKTPEAHKITRITENRVKCTCGWTVVNDDPAELQDNIAAHYRSTVVAAGRKPWPQRKRELEHEAEVQAILKEEKQQ